MWELSEAVDGMAQACRDLGVPVVGGNVSLYNESSGVDIDPTPVVGVLGIVDELGRRPPGPALPADAELLLIGPEPVEPSLAGSRWAWDRGERGGVLPPLDAAMHLAVAAFVRALVADDLAVAVHDVGEGGVGLTLAEAAVAGGVGATVTGVDGLASLFGESPSRVLAAVAPAHSDTVHRRADEANVPVRAIGRTGGRRLVVDGVVDLSIETLARDWRDELPIAFGGASTP
jgi:phosphoribosylformylglycinamidine synthase